MKSGIELISQERERQIIAEGWTADHDDDMNFHEELAIAAGCYILWDDGHNEHPCPPDIWPWDSEWWKPANDRIRNLAKAGALIAAEIDRLQRSL